jgi:predicted tellurium resistance membrane protein TerC
MDSIIALVSLAGMEIVLGIDNIVFIAILTGRLPEKQRALGRNIGLAVALISRLALLGLLFMITHNSFFDKPIYELTNIIHEERIADIAAFTSGEGGQGAHGTTSQEVVKSNDDAFDAINEITIRDLILFVGGIFLMWKSIHEIHNQFDDHHEKHKKPETAKFSSVLIQIGILDLVFSLDSVITAVGMVDELWIMVTAMIIAVIVMLIFSKSISSFIERHPTLKMLALSFLILIGGMLVIESLGSHFNKNYIYFAMGFSLIVEMLNIRQRGKRRKVIAADQT